MILLFGLWDRGSLAAVFLVLDIFTRGEQRPGYPFPVSCRGHSI
jgi:hypothetical protein